MVTGQGLLGNNMFAYCLNNPVNRMDVSGAISIWYYLIKDSDMGYIHRLVVDHIRRNNPVATEVTLSHYGRADIVQSEIGAVWEVKHTGTNPALRAATAALQAYSYILLNDEVTCLGNAGAFSGTLYIQCLSESYEVSYTTPFNGVVLYTVKEMDGYEGSYDAIYVPKSLQLERDQTASQFRPIPIIAAGLALGGGGYMGTNKGNAFRDVSVY